MQDVATKQDLHDLKTELKQDIREILDVIQHYAGHIDGRLGKIDQQFNTIDARFDGIDTRFDRIETRLDGTDTRLVRAESLMVTKDYLDEKLWDLRGDMVSMTRREARKHEERYHALT